MALRTPFRVAIATMTPKTAPATPLTGPADTMAAAPAGSRTRENTEREDKCQRDTHDDAYGHNRVADDDVSSAAPQQHRDLHHPMLDDRVRKRQGQQQKGEQRADPQPERQVDELYPAAPA